MRERQASESRRQPCHRRRVALVPMQDRRKVAKNMAGLGLGLLLLSAALAAAQQPVRAAGDPARGAKLFKRCRACHSVVEGRNKIGPSLYGVLGRKAGSLPNYPYSQALRSAGWVWTKEMLDKWIAGPKAVLPGTKMIFPGLPDPQDRADVIAFLAQVGDKAGQ